VKTKRKMKVKAVAAVNAGEEFLSQLHFWQ
jgi:hypothetical protein